jgi:hypothetical protein
LVTITPSKLPEELEFQSFFGQLRFIVVIPIPKSKGTYDEGASKWFVSRLFGKFTPLSPTLKLLKGRRFHFTHNLGHWTPLTLNPSNALLAMLKTGKNGGWLTVVTRWCMRYLLREITSVVIGAPEGIRLFLLSWELANHA